MVDILDQFAENDKEHFNTDFCRLIKMAIQMDSDWAQGDTRFYRNKPKYQEYAKLFSEKYKTIVCNPVYSLDSKFMRVFFPGEATVVEVLKHTVTKMSGLLTIGHSPFKWVSIKDERAFSNAVQSMRDIAYCTFSSGTLILEWAEDKEMPELIINKQIIENPNGPELRLACYYGLYQGFDTDMNLDDIEKSFEFSVSGMGKPSIGVGK